MLGAFPRRAHDSIGLVAVLSGKPTMGSHHFAQRVNLFAVASRVGGDFGGLFPVAAGTFQILPYLLAAGAGRVQVVLGVTLDLRGAASTGGDFITKLTQPVGQLRLVDGRGELLRGEETLRLQGAVLAVVTLGDIKDDGVSVELWSGVAVHGPGGIVLELGGNELCSGLRWMVPANAGHRVVLQVLQRDTDAHAMCRAYSIVGAYERGQRDGFRS
jgi:hypothetical protein